MLAASQPNAPNPMAQVMADTMKPVLHQIIQTILGGVLDGFQPAQTSPGKVQDTLGQAQPQQEQSQGASEQNTGESSQGSRASHDTMGVMPDNVTIITEEDDIDV